MLRIMRAGDVPSDLAARLRSLTHRSEGTMCEEFTFFRTQSRSDRYGELVADSGLVVWEEEDGIIIGWSFLYNEGQLGRIMIAGGRADADLDHFKARPIDDWRCHTYVRASNRRTGVGTRIMNVVRTIRPGIEVWTHTKEAKGFYSACQMC